MKQVPQSPRPGPADSQASRRREVENALLTQNLCGRPVSAAVRAQLRRYEAGEVNREVAFAGLYAGAS